MGKGGYVKIFNLDPKKSQSLYLEASECMNNDGEGNFNTTVQPQSFLINSHDHGTQVRVEASGSGGCAFTQSYFCLRFSNGARLTVKLQTEGVSVNLLTEGDIICNSEFDFFAPWELYNSDNDPHIAAIILPTTPPGPIYKYLPDDTSKWMEQLNEHTEGAFYKKRLNEICIPSAHDAGMSSAPRCEIANANQTVTQTLDLKGQLEAGVRFLDLRPLKWGNDPFTFGHFKSQKIIGSLPVEKGMGCSGQDMAGGLAQVAKFVDDNPGEVVFLSFGQSLGEDGKDLNLATKRKMVGEIKRALGTDRIYTSDDANFKLNELTLNDILFEQPKKKADDGAAPKTTEVPEPPKPLKKRIICIFDYIDELIDPSTGIFKLHKLADANSKGNYGLYDLYGATDSLSTMIADQVGKLQHFRGAQHTGDNTARNGLFNFSFTLTQTNTDAIMSAALDKYSIRALAAYANRNLWMVINTLDQQKIPNLINLDYVNATNAISAAMYFNLPKGFPAIFGSMPTPLGIGGSVYLFYRNETDKMTTLWIDAYGNKNGFKIFDGSIPDALAAPVFKPAAMTYDTNKVSLAYINSAENLCLTQGEITPGTVSFPVFTNLFSQAVYENNLLKATPVPKISTGLNEPACVYYAAQQHYLYADVSGHISDIFYGNSRWNYQCLHTVGNIANAPQAGIPGVKEGPVCYVFNNEMHSVYVDVNDMLSDIWYDASGWHYECFQSATCKLYFDPEDEAGVEKEVPAAERKNYISDSIPGIAIGNNQVHHFFRSGDGLYDIWFKNDTNGAKKHYVGSRCRHMINTDWPRGVATREPTRPSGDPKCYYYNNTIYYTCIHNQNWIAVFWKSGNDWLIKNFQFMATTWMTDQNAMGCPPFPMTKNLNNELQVLVTNGVPHILYLDENEDMSDLFYKDNRWNHRVMN